MSTLVWRYQSRSGPFSPEGQHVILEAGNNSMDVALETNDADASDGGVPTKGHISPMYNNNNNNACTMKDSQEEDCIT